MQMVRSDKHNCYRDQLVAAALVPVVGPDRSMVVVVVDTAASAAGIELDTAVAEAFGIPHTN